MEFEPYSALTVTVPGAAAAWEDTVKMYGRLSLKQVCSMIAELTSFWIIVLENQPVSQAIYLLS